MDELKRLVECHHNLRPLMRARDHYKLLYQGEFGVGHIMSDDALPKLIEEAERVKSLEPHDEPIVESVHVDGDMVRVNLRPFTRGGGSLEALHGAMVESSRVKGDPIRFLRLWRRFKEVAAHLDLMLDEEEVCEIDDTLGERGPVPMHHTAAYREAYYPAYRVVRRADLEAFGLFPGR